MQKWEYLQVTAWMGDNGSGYVVNSIAREYGLPSSAASGFNRYEFIQSMKTGSAPEEYEQLHVMDVLNKYGAEGWEVVSMQWVSLREIFDTWNMYNADIKRKCSKFAGTMVYLLKRKKS